MTPQSNASSKILHDSPPLAQASQASRLYDSTHGPENVEGIEAVLNAERMIASSTGKVAEELVKRVASPPLVKSDLGGHDYLWAALVLMHQGKFADAAIHFEQAMVLGIRHWRLNCYLASALGKSGRIAEAFLALNEARQVVGDQALVVGVQRALLDVASPATDAFTDNGFWTPQTFMLRAIRAWVSQSATGPASTGLSIDDNPTLDQILLERWPSLKISRAVYPELDCQRLTQIADNTYDIVYSNQVLEHVPKPWFAGAELVRILRPGGLGLHTTCAYNPRHGPPAFNDYYRFLPDGLAELFDGVEVLVKAGWGNRGAILYNLAINDGHGALGGRRFHPAVGQENDPHHPWTTWIIFRKLGPNAS